MTVAALARRVLLIETGAELLRRAETCRQRATQLRSGTDTAALVEDYSARADAHEWLADQLTRLLADGADQAAIDEDASEDTRRALPDREESPPVRVGDVARIRGSVSTFHVGRVLEVERCILVEESGGRLSWDLIERVEDAS